MLSADSKQGLTCARSPLASPTTGPNFLRLLPSCLSPGFSPSSRLSNLPMEAVATPACLEACRICTSPETWFSESGMKFS